MAYQKSFSTSVSGGKTMASPDSVFLSPSIQSSPPCLPKLCPINRPRQFLYSLMVITTYRKDSYITDIQLLFVYFLNVISFYLFLMSIFVRNKIKSFFEPCIPLVNDSIFFPTFPIWSQSFEDAAQHKSRA